MALRGGLSFINTVEILGRPGDAGIFVPLQGRGQEGVGRLPLQKGTGHRVESQEHREHAGAGTGQAHDDPWAPDPLLAHLGVVERPAVQLDAVGQRPGQHLGDQEAAEGSELGLVPAGGEVHLERFTVGVGAQIVGAGQLDGRLDH
jgi:hypothetical protein